MAANGVRQLLGRALRSLALHHDGNRMSDQPTCRACRFFEDDPHELERLLPGVLVLSSTYGSSRGDSGICSIRETFQQPEQGCHAFAARRQEA